jgi:nitroreductase
MNPHRESSPGHAAFSALDAIFMRRSIRDYAPGTLEEETVRSLLDAAVQAPSAMHMEPWAFVVVQDRATLKRLSDRAKGSWAAEATKFRDLHPVADTTLARGFAERFASPDFCIFYDASTLIVICAKSMGPFVSADCWLAAENLMLAACALGLGTCCIGSAVPMLNGPQTRSELGIPDGIEAVVPIIVGVPRGPASPSTRKDPEILSWKKSRDVQSSPPARPALE